jgi:hypothetical protein
MVAFGDNNRIDESAPADGTHEVAVVCRHIVEGSQVDLSFLHIVYYMDALSEVEGTGSRLGRKKKELDTRNKGRCCIKDPPGLALHGPAFDARLPLPLPLFGQYSAMFLS